MPPALDEWDEKTLLELKGTAERAFLEIKASSLVNDDNASFPNTKAEIAKQVCAFANSGGGYLVIGVNNQGELDAGIPILMKGREDAKAWIEKIIPTLTIPATHGCEAKVITTSAHESGKCAIVIQVPLSELRPHWVRENSKDIPYIRAGEHSYPMPLQTFRDMIGRSEAARATITQVGCARTPRREGQTLSVYVWPKVQLLAGTICREWLMKIEIVGGAGQFYPHLLKDLPRTDCFSSHPRCITIKGQCPLMRGSAVPLTTEPLEMKILIAKGLSQKIRATLYVPGADTCVVERQINDDFQESEDSE